MNISTAAERLQQGEVIAIPTDTVYGLATTLGSAEKLFTLKGRNTRVPIPILAASVDQIMPFLDWPPENFFQLAENHWPGPLTLVVPVKPELVPAVVRADGASVGFRIPNHPLTLELLIKTGPLAVTSANRSGGVPATTAGQVREIFGPNFPILDGGVCNGIPSTVLIWEGEAWHTSRLGPVDI